MVTYFKAVRQNGRDFHSNTVRWISRDGVYPYTVRHPSSTKAVAGDWSTCLAVSVTPMQLAGANWPWRLLTVVPGEDKVVKQHPLSEKLGSVSWVVTGEIDPTRPFGPQREHIVKITDRTKNLTQDEVKSLLAVNQDTQAYERKVAYQVLTNLIWGSYRESGVKAATTQTYASVFSLKLSDAKAQQVGRVVEKTVRALIFRDLLRLLNYEYTYDLLTRPWRSVIGPIHPGDKPL